eukprot:9167135-Pyramimonas_sp.AAC.1
MTWKAHELTMHATSPNRDDRPTRRLTDIDRYQCSVVADAVRGFRPAGQAGQEARQGVAAVGRQGEQCTGYAARRLC